MYQISISENLKRILSARKFTMPLSPNLGLGDYADSPLSTEMLLRLKKDILEQIALYEPRISPQNVKIIAKDDTLVLQIQAQNLQITLRPEN